VTHLRQIMLEELRRRNYAESTIRTYIRTVEHFSRYFHRPPDQLGPEHIREYQAALFTRWKLASNTVTQWLAAAKSLLRCTGSEITFLVRRKAESAQTASRNAL
jgi:integrase/recombinase XerD